MIRSSDNPASPNPDWNSASPDPASSNAPYRILNIGNSQPVKLSAYVQALENALGKKAIVELLPLQPGDVPDTYSDVSRLQSTVGYKPETDVVEGVGRFVTRYHDYYKA